MSTVLKFDRNEMGSQELVERLAAYRLLPQMFRELAVDAAIATVELDDAENVSARNQFLEQNRIVTPEAQAAWLQGYYMTQEQLEALTVRAAKVEKFKQETWGQKVEAYFLQRKAKLDQVVYSLLRTRDADVATELYFRLKDGEAEFGELAQQYSEGPEAQTGGIVGPVPLSTPHERLAQILSTSQPGQLSPPVRVGEWNVILRLEKLVSAQLDDGTRQRLIDEMFRTWLEEQVREKAEVVLTAADDSDSNDPPNAPEDSATTALPTP